VHAPFLNNFTDSAVDESHQPKMTDREETPLVPDGVLVAERDHSSLKVDLKIPTSASAGDLGNSAMPEAAVRVAAPENVDSRSISLLQWPDEDWMVKDMLESQVNNVCKMAALRAKQGRLLDDVRLPLLRTLLNSLPDIEMTPYLKRTQIDLHLKFFFDPSSYVGGTPPNWSVPEDVQTMARNIYEEWEADNWGITEETLAAEAAEAAASAELRASRAQQSSRHNTNQVFTGRRPNPNHPIYGESGIMRGIVLAAGHRRTYKFDPTFRRRNAGVQGHNGLQVGAYVFPPASIMTPKYCEIMISYRWWPLQLCACRDGAHGAPMAGISGTRSSGAYSIVVSKMYEGLDEDHGEILYYSAPNSIDNTDRNRAASSAGAEALLTAKNTNQLVRVLRSAAAKHQSAPPSGIQYHGL
jgi:SAD/SRA domain